MYNTIMNDFSVEIEWQCISQHTYERKVGGYIQWNLFQERAYPRCNCPAYFHGKRTVNFGGTLYPKFCKHIIEAEKDVCDFHSFTRPKNDICPDCGKNVVPQSIIV